MNYILLPGSYKEHFEKMIKKNSVLKHDAKIKHIASSLGSIKNHARLKIIKNTVSHQVPKADKKKNMAYIDISDLNDILSIDTKNKICVCEPGVTFIDLVNETLKHKLIPKLVPELKTITVGGAISGCSVESMSYKYGGFHDSCIEYEIITGKGEILVCSRKKNSLLFEMVHGSFGTIGIITKIKFELIDSKKYVKMEYISFSSLNEYKKGIKKFCDERFDFVDGIIHSKKQYVLCLGKFVDKAQYVSKYDWMRIFYRSTKIRKQDYMLTQDYFFRYDSDCHWIARNYGLENPIIRLLFGKLILGSTRLLNAAYKLKNVLPQERPDVVVDVFIPFSKLDEFFEFYYKNFNYFPIWIVPYKMKKYPWIAETLKNKERYFIDIAIYGFKQKDDINYYKLLEDKLLSIGGTKTLISHNYLSETDFWKLWNKKNYEKAKQISDPDNRLGDIFTKMVGR